MADKRILIIDADVVKKIDENRGEVSRSEFLDMLIDTTLTDNRLKDIKEKDTQNYVSKEEFYQFAEGMKELMRNFLEFFISYGMALGKQPENEGFEDLKKKVHSPAKPSPKTEQH